MSVHPAEGPLTMWPFRLTHQETECAAAQIAGDGVVRLTSADAIMVGQLHRSTISTSFLSTLGERFGRYLYKGILSSPDAFGFAAKGPDGRILGYVACAQSTSRVYVQGILRDGVMMAMSLLPHIWRGSVLRRLWETLRYPSEIPSELPQAEILSIGVSPEAHGRGIGTRLMTAALGEFRRRGTLQVRVAVWTGNTTAIKFYERCGFELTLQRTHHGRPMNVYTIDLGQPRIGGLDAPWAEDRGDAGSKRDSGVHDSVAAQSELSAEYGKTA